MKYKMLIFDMDGTILDTLEDLKNATNYVLREYGMPERTLEEVRRFVGNGIRNLLRQAVVDETSEEKLDTIFETFREYYKDHCADSTCPYEGITDIIITARNQGYLTAVVSNKADFAVQELCEKYFPGLFDCAVGEKDGVRRKPYPDSVLSVLEQFDLDVEDAVYIGDSDVDFQTSQNANMDVIMVGWGFREEDFLKSLGAPFVIKSPNEILNHI